jgi:hypothetical protein
MDGRQQYPQSRIRQEDERDRVHPGIDTLRDQRRSADRDPDLRRYPPPIVGNDKYRD